ncbi:MAG: signal transduction histidine kinase [Polaribacter sp.]|jgi:signal transduction histidine kinase
MFKTPPTQLHPYNGGHGGIPFMHNGMTLDAEVTEDDIKILIIDDEVGIGEEICEKLEFHGFRCAFATDAKSGLELVRLKKSISIVLTDIRMPGMNGLEMCKLIRNEISVERDLALLIMTGHAGMSEALEALKVGALDFLTKPLSPDLLVHAVKRADQQIKALMLERDFKDQLKTLVEEKTGELEKLNTALMISNQVKDEFLLMISHELRTPLNLIIGFAEIIESDIATPEQKEFISEIKVASWQLTEMVNSMMDMVAVETKTFDLHISDVDVMELVTQAVSAYEGKAKQAEVTIDTSNIPSMSVKLDPVRISQAIGRLVDNAINFSSAGGIVQITAQQTHDGLMISVQDNGAGMSEPEITKALQLLRQVDGSTTKKQGGIGVGLFLAKTFSELHRGSLSINSEPGHGTTITLIIPEQ